MISQPAFNNDRVLRNRCLYAVRATRSEAMSRDHFCEVSMNRFGIPKNLSALIWAIPDPYVASPVFFDIRVGKDLSPVEHQFYLWSLQDSEFGMIRLANEEGKSVIGLVSDLCNRALNNDMPSQEIWGECAKLAWEVTSVAAEIADSLEVDDSEIVHISKAEPPLWLALAKYFTASAVHQAVMVAAYIADVHLSQATQKDVVQAIIDACGYAGDARYFSTKTHLAEDPDEAAAIECSSQLSTLVS